MGESNRNSAANQLNKELQSQNFTVNNRFDNYHNPFGYNNAMSEFEKLYKTGISDINDNSMNDLAQANQGTVARLASQGITGGSILNNAITQNTTDAGRNRVSAISRLTQNRLSQGANLMQDENNNAFRANAMAQNVDQQNMGNRMNQFGMRMNNLQNLDDTTWLDDLLATINTGANIFGAGFPRK